MNMNAYRVTGVTMSVPPYQRLAAAPNAWSEWVDTTPNCLTGRIASTCTRRGRFPRPPDGAGTRAGRSPAACWTVTPARGPAGTEMPGTSAGTFSERAVIHATSVPLWFSLPEDRCTRLVIMAWRTGYLLRRSPESREDYRLS